MPEPPQSVGVSRAARAIAAAHAEGDRRRAAGHGLEYDIRLVVLAEV